MVHADGSMQFAELWCSRDATEVEDMEEETLNERKRPNRPDEDEEEEDKGHFDSLGSTSHLKERSKSVSIICPSSLTKTFSGLRSL